MIFLTDEPILITATDGRVITITQHNNGIMVECCNDIKAAVRPTRDNSSKVFFASNS